MPEIMLLSIIHAAMDLTGADGLWNGNGPCGCGRGDLAPCGGIKTDCVLAKSGTVRKGEDDENNAVGDTVWYPMQVPSVAKESIPTVQPPPVDAAGTSGRGGVGCDGLLGRSRFYGHCRDCRHLNTCSLSSLPEGGCVNLEKP